MTITLITITGTVRKGNGDPWPCAQFTIDLISTIVSDADEESVYPRGKQTINCGENGIIPTTGTVPTVAAGYTYKLTLPDGAKGEFVVPPELAPSVTIDAIVALITGGEADPTQGYTGVTIAERAWLTLALATVPDATDLIPDAASDGTQYARKDGAWDAVASGATPDVDGITTDTGNAAEMIRVDGDGTGLEYRTPAQVLSDIGAETAGAAATVAGDLTSHENETTTAHGNILPEDAGIVSVSSGRDLAATDAGKILECTGTFTLNCPNGLDAGFQVALCNVGAGIITISATTTLTAKGAAYTLANQYGMGTLYHRGSNVWLLAGDLT